MIDLSDLFQNLTHQNSQTLSSISLIEFANIGLSHHDKQSNNLLIQKEMLNFYSCLLSLIKTLF